MLDSLIAQAITTFITTTILKGGEEIGKNIGKDFYDKVKNIFKKEKQKNIFSNLLNDPASRQCQEEFENELQNILSKSNGIPKELTFVLDIMSVNVAILETMYESYVSIKYKHRLAYISWNEAAGESDADYQEKIKILENKLHSLSEKVIKMLNTKKQSTPE